MGDRCLAIDTETTGVGWYDQPFCVSIAERFHKVGHPISTHVFDIRNKNEYLLCKTKLSTSSDQHWVFHNAKFDLQKLELVGLLPSMEDVHIEDTLIMAHLLNENRDNSLKALARDYLNLGDEMVEVEIKSGPNKGQKRFVPAEQHAIKEARKKLKLKKEDGYDKIPWEVVKPYAEADARYTLLLFEYFRPRIIKENLSDVYLKEIELVEVLLSMEEAGLKVNREELLHKLSMLESQESSIRGTIFQITENIDFNPLSNKQVKEFLNAEGFEVESVDKNALQAIADKSELAKEIIKLRTVSKLRNTYLTPLFNESATDGKLHPSYKSNVSTGRMSSGEHKGD